MHMASRILFSILCATVAMPVLAALSDVDPSFGVDGQTVTPTRETLQQPGEPAVDSHGRIYIPVSDMMGVVDLPQLNPDPEANNTHAAIVRLMPSGRFDEQFGTNGILELPVSPAIVPVAIAVDEKENRLIVAGSIPYPNPVPNPLLEDLATAVVMRFAFDGTLDTTFGENGIVELAPLGVASVASAIELLDDGRILTALVSNGNPSVSRLLPDGSIDQDFGTDGFARLTWSSRGRVPSVLRRDHDGGIFVCGPRQFWVGGVSAGYPEDGVHVGRLNADGTPVAGFGDVKVDVDNRAACLDLRPREDGAFSVVAAMEDELIVARLHADGSRDTAFNDTGLDSGEFSSVMLPVGYALDNGQLLIARSGGALRGTGVEDSVIFTPPGMGGIVVTRLEGLPELARAGGSNPGNGENDGGAGSDDSDGVGGNDENSGGDGSIENGGNGDGGGGAFAPAALAVLGFLGLLRRRIGRARQSGA